MQFGTSEDNRLETSICDKPLVLDPIPPAGRFELYPTENTFNFILLDKDFGTTYQVQWGFEYKDRLRLPISGDSDVVWSFGYAPISANGILLALTANGFQMTFSAACRISTNMDSQLSSVKMENTTCFQLKVAYNSASGMITLAPFIGKMAT